MVYERCGMDGMSSPSARAPSALVFVVKFALLFAVLMGGFEASRGTVIERVVVTDGILVPTTTLIRLAAPDEHVELVGHTIRSPSSKLNVTRGCEGVEVLLMLVAALLAFPATWRSRIRGLAIGFAVAYVLSVARLIALHFTLRYAPGAWEALHGLILPLAPILVVTAYFLLWSESVGRSTASATQAPVPQTHE